MFVYPSYHLNISFPSSASFQYPQKIPTQIKLTKPNFRTPKNRGIENSNPKKSFDHPRHLKSRVPLLGRAGGGRNTWRFAGSNFLGSLLFSPAVVHVLFASQLLAPFKMVKRFLPCVMVNTKDLRRPFWDCPWCFSSLLGRDYHKENSLVDVVF